MSGQRPVVRSLTLDGREWTIREVRLPTLTGEQARALVFDSGLEQRAVSPVPSGWVYWDPARLHEAWLSARPLLATPQPLPEP